LATFYLFAEAFMRLLGQPSALVELAGPYILALAPGWPFMLGVLVLRNFLAAIDRTRAPLIVIILTTLLNAFFNYLLIFGSWGFPRLELVGAGIASSLAHFIGFSLLALYVLKEREARRFELFTRIFQPDWERLREVARLGWPISVTIGFEALLFNACVFVMGRIGVNEVAAYHVALNVAAVAFMIPFGMSMAGATRVGLAQGAGDIAGVRRSAVASIIVCVAIITAFAIPIALSPQLVASLYLKTDDPANAAVIDFVSAFLPIAAAFMVFDAVQVASGQALRGLKDVNVPMILTGVSYWVIGFPLVVWLALFSPVGAVGVWWGLLTSLVAASILLGGRLWFLVRPGRDANRETGGPPASPEAG
ncbi:MAG: MATE family efflux transporter, partial [Pseudomonadota bacterium]